ncbi:MAG: YvcK family protein [Lactobacillales bacterium]|nr:YvcK family protein [Lactobacillales bacterium]
MKKIVILGGGTGMATLLSGLKNFPVEITSVVSVCDDGQSTGRLREEFNMPAMGDIRKVLVSLSVTEPLVEELLNYRFNTTSDLNGHTVGNLLLTATSNITGNLKDGIEVLSKILNLKGKVLPLTEDNVTLVGKMIDNEKIIGEHNITMSNKKIKTVYYQDEPKVCEEVLEEIEEADLIILSMGSLYTSIIPNLICREVIKKLDKSKKKIMYVCNMVTQPGETDNMKTSDHIKIINNYLGKHKIDVVIANNGKISNEIAIKYSTLEQKDPVYLDKENIDSMNIELIENNYVTIKDDIIRHNVEKLALDIYSYLVR